MPRTSIGRRQKKKCCSHKTTKAQDNPANPTTSPEHSPTDGNRKYPPHTTVLSKEPNPSINLDSGSNAADPKINKVNNEESSNLIGEGKETSIR